MTEKTLIGQHVLLEFGVTVDAEDAECHVRPFIKPRSEKGIRDFVKEVGKFEAFVKLTHDFMRGLYGYIESIDDEKEVKE